MDWPDSASGEHVVSFQSQVLLDGHQHRGADSSLPPWL